MIQALQEDDYARKFLAPAGGIKHLTFFDTVNERGVEQLLSVFTEWQKQAAGTLPSEDKELGNLVAIDGPLIDSVLSMHSALISTRVSPANCFCQKAKVQKGPSLVK